MSFASAALASVSFVVKDEFWWRKLRLKCPDGPFGIVKIKHWIDTNEIHICLVISIESTNIAPIGNGLFVFVLEVEGMNIKPRDNVGDDVFAKVVGTVFTDCIFKQKFKQRCCGKNIDTHRGEGEAGVTYDFGWMLRFFDKGGNAVFCIDIQNSKLVGFIHRNWNATNGKIGSSFDMEANHFAVVHFVDMVCCKNDDIFWVCFFDDINVLVNSICGAFVPVFINSLLWGKYFDILIELWAEEIPA